jgi:hypothetical protein
MFTSQTAKHYKLDTSYDMGVNLLSKDASRESCCARNTAQERPQGTQVARARGEYENILSCCTE